MLKMHVGDDKLLIDTPAGFLEVFSSQFGTSVKLTPAPFSEIEREPIDAFVANPFITKPT